MLRGNLLATPGAEPADGEMPEVGSKAMLPKQGLLKRGQQRLIEVNDGATLPADEVVMAALVGRVIAEPAPAEVGLGHQGKLLQQVQGPVDSGDIDVGVSGDDMGIHLFSADVVIAVLDGVQYHQPLRCQPVALLAQRAGYVSNVLHAIPPGSSSLLRVYYQNRRIDASSCNYNELQNVAAALPAIMLRGSSVSRVYAVYIWLKPLPGRSTPAPWAFSIQPNSLRICWL